ncbi:MAG: magnesium transporter CorA family protein [Anaerolineae bacterium]|nr:magnesium transporter CorA family protein [Anaerolineae bacterium]
MISIFKSSELGLRRLDEPMDGSWIHLTEPTHAEISQLSAEYHVPEDFFTYPLDIDEMPRTEANNGATLIGLRVPVFQGEHADISYATAPLAIIITERVLFTVAKFDMNLTSDLAITRVRDLSTSKKNRFVLYLLLAVASKYLFYLRKINREIDAVEDQLQLSMRNKEVLQLLKYQKSLTLFTTALKSNELMIGRLQKTQLFQRYEDDKDLLDDVLTEFNQAIEMTNISNNILSAMMDAYASIISNNLNVVMKFLASFTIVLAIPTLVASIYGMNIGLPFQQHEAAFVLVAGATGIVTVGVIWLFLKRDWL